MQKEIKSIIRQIADLLMVNGSFLINPGLFSGDMGVVLFFTRYARYTQNELYLDYSYDLIGKIQKRINRESPINYKNGLAGIGATIEYLVQHRFIEADTDNILIDFDQRILYTYNLSYFSIDKMMDVAYYTAWRLTGNSRRKEMIRKIILPQITKGIGEKWKKWMNEWGERQIQFNRTSIPVCFGEKTYDYCMELISHNNFWNKDLGILNGIAGWGMSLLTELDGNDSWYLLFPNDFILFNENISS